MILGMYGPLQEHKKYRAGFESKVESSSYVIPSLEAMTHCSLQNASQAASYIDFRYTRAYILIISPET